MSEPLRLIDAHCHVNFHAYAKDADEVIRRSLAKGIGVVNVGTQTATSAKAVELANRYDNVWAVIGQHPIHLFEQQAQDEEEIINCRSEKFNPDYYRRLAKSSPKVVGLGECGLDYYHLPENLPRETVVAAQENLFRAHLDLALGLDLAVMIHCRDAHDETVRILEEYTAKGKHIRGDIHCFTGTWAEAERYLKLGLFVSFTGIVTYPQKKADREAGLEPLVSVAARIPLDRLIVETDAPYLSPAPHRGQRNEPANVEFVANAIAAARGLTPEELAQATLENTKRLFKL
ncbi:MAG: TatD family hydrolase [Patescibacteria group bacterium]|nr:TatD family hydrolase [Patescibacteria group bacterium]